MFKHFQDKTAKAESIASWLSNHGHFKSHSRHISRSDLESKGLRIEYLENKQTIQDSFLSVFHATTHTFNGTSAVKIIENHKGNAFIKQFRQQMIIGGPPGVPSHALMPIIEGKPVVLEEGKEEST